MNKSLKTLHDADQRDRQGLPKFGTKAFEKRVSSMSARDKVRQKKVEQILKTHKNLDGVDYYHAAMVFQHSHIDQKRAVTLAKKSMKLGNENAKWLYAAAYDRMLRGKGKKQKFGTQFWLLKNGKAKVQPYDKRTSDRTRAKFNVLPIKQRLKELNSQTKQRK